MAKRQQFTKAFKLEAVRLWKSSGRPASAVARELDVRRNHLYKWQVDLEPHGQLLRQRGGQTLFSTLNNELVHDQDFLTREAAQAAVFEFIKVFYNRQRLHSNPRLRQSGAI